MSTFTLGMSRLDLSLKRAKPTTVMAITAFFYLRTSIGSNRSIRDKGRCQMAVYCVALDPGGTTGVCLIRDDPWFFELLQLGPEPHYLPLLNLLALWKPELIIAESFQNRGQDSAILASCEYLGVVKVYVQLAGCKLVLQPAASGKQFWDDTKLRNYGLWAPGMRHARDAVRHYLYYRTFTIGDKSLLKGRQHVSCTQYVD